MLQRLKFWYITKNYLLNFNLYKMYKRKSPKRNKSPKRKSPKRGGVKEPLKRHTPRYLEEQRLKFFEKNYDAVMNEFPYATYWQIRDELYNRWLDTNQRVKDITYPTM